jgi:signal transduction histidine kinase
LNTNEINCIFENKDGKIWLATQGGGINIMHPDSATFFHLTMDNGLPGNDVQGILADSSGKKWASTNRGIVSIDPEHKNKPFTYYHHSDGIQGETFKVNAWYKSADGEMFFGGDNGFTRFYPRDIVSNSIPPKIGLTYLRISNQVVKIGDTISDGNIMVKSLDETDRIVLPYQKNSFSIGVGVHHFQHPEGNMIRYKLEGFNDRWITLPAATNPYIYFSKVPDGRYILHISGMSADNMEADRERLIHIRILPPWYKAWYMTTLFLLTIIAMIGGVIYMVVRRQRISYEKMIDAISLENNENKMKILTNIAHELRTPLSLVIAPIEDMMQNYTTIEPRWKDHITLIHRNSNYLLTLINQIIDFRKLHAGKLQINLQSEDIVSLVRNVAANFKGLESRRKANLQVRVPDKAVMVKIDGQKIEEVLYNLLSNAFKHTSEHQSIIVSLDLVKGVESNTGKNEKQIRITVFNEGKDSILVASGVFLSPEYFSEKKFSVSINRFH